VSAGDSWNIVDEPSLVTDAQVRQVEELQQQQQQQQSQSQYSSTQHFAHSIKLQVRESSSLRTG
jgi:hypothetical protein